MEAYVDGACRISNPGLAASAWVFYDNGTEFYSNAKVHAGLNTNNFSEYQGLLGALRQLRSMDIKGATIYSDSKVIVLQSTGVWSAKENLAKYAREAYALLVQGEHTLLHMRGHEKDPRKGLHRGNTRADELCNKVLDEYQEKNV